MSKEDRTLRVLRDSTQRPWSWRAAAKVEDGIYIGSESNNAAWVPGYNDHPHNIANAALIVTAVNSHEALLLALEQAANALWDAGKNAAAREAEAAFTQATAKQERSS